MSPPAEVTEGTETEVTEGADQHGDTETRRHGDTETHGGSLVRDWIGSDL